MNVTGLSEAELVVMRIIWDEDGGIFLSPLMEKLESMGKKWKPNTVLTFLARLTEKGMISVEKHGRINQYIALCTESDYMESLNQTFLGMFYGGKAKNLVAALLRQDCLSTDDITELQQFWKEKGDQNE